MSAPGDLRAAAGALSTSALCDAMMRRHAHRAHVTGLVSPTPERPLVGPAVTMRFLPLRRDLFRPKRHDFAAVLLEAVGDAPEGRVLVASNGGAPDAALAGGKKLARLANLGMEGILCDARLRDFGEVAGLGVGAWCRGETVRQSSDALMPVAAGVPVQVGGATVVPGDWIVADAAGAVVVPAGDLHAVLEEAGRIERADAATVDRQRAEDRAWREARAGR